MNPAIKFILTSVLFVLALLSIVQYSLVYPGIFADLPSDFTTEHPKVTIGLVNDEEGSQKYLHYNADNNDADLVVFFHGNYETVDQNFSAIAQLTGMTNDVLLVEYPGFGASQGWPTTTKIVNNTRTIINKYRKQDQALVLWGRSLGGAFAMEMAITENPKALILESTFLHPLNALTGGILKTALKPFFFLDLNSEAKISALDPSMPVLLLHGNEDTLFDVNISHDMKGLMSHMPVEQVIFDGGHNARAYPFDVVIEFLAKTQSE
jgi:pimeloyl-ACP methyl ester carboxylesterase